jgi:hypothetical protein
MGSAQGPSVSIAPVVLSEVVACEAGDNAVEGFCVGSQHHRRVQQFSLNPSGDLQVNGGILESKQ